MSNAKVPTRQTRRKPGRPLIGDARKMRINVMLAPDVAERLRRLGDGNLSAGIAIAAEKIRR